MYDVQPYNHAGERHGQLRTDAQLGAKGQVIRKIYEGMRTGRRRLVPCRAPEATFEKVVRSVWVWERHSNCAATG